MAKGANGTIDIENFAQLTNQRTAITNRNTAFTTGGKSYGVATDQISTLFASSPLISANRVADANNDRGSLWTNAAGDLYKAYAAVVDSDVVGGFGFKKDETISLDYRADSNPFITDEGTTDFNALTTGQAEGTGNKRRFLGYPDLAVPDSIEGGSYGYEDPAAAPSGDLVISKKNNFGTSTSQDRLEINSISGGLSLLGTFNADAITPDDELTTDVDEATDFLGKYFTKNYTSSGA